MLFTDLQTEYTKFYFIDDFEAMEIVWAAYIGAGREGIPLWLRVIGPPSFTKTTLTSPLSLVPMVSGTAKIPPSGRRTVMCSNLTHATLTTGYRKAKPLLDVLKDRVLVINDMSNIQSQHPDKRAEIYAQLRAAYDGEWDFLYGGDVSKISGAGYFGLICACTRSIESDSILSQRLGERYLDVRVRNTNRIQKAQAAMAQCGGEKAISDHLKKHTGDFLLEKWDNPIAVNPITSTQRDHIIDIAELVARARTPVHRDRELRVINQVPDVEGPMRLSKQLKRLAECLAEIRGVDTVRPEELATVKRVALDCIVPERKQVLVSVSTIDDPTMTVIANEVGLNRKVTERIVEELELVGLIRDVDCAPWGRRYYPTEMTEKVMK
jgi:hypothetical protein